jgi:hypothetical protein
VRRRICSGILLPLIFIAQGYAQQLPCNDTPEFRQLDFWIGEWDVLNPKGEHVGESSIQLILGECVVFENYSSARGYAGKSFNIYNRTQQRWQQFWVDNQGGVLEFSGQYINGQLLYTGESMNREGAKVTHRMSFTNTPNTTVRQLWEQSTDDGSTWTVAFDGTYVRKKQ